VIAHGRSSDKARRVADQLVEAGWRANHCAGDLTFDSAANHVAEDVVAATGVGDVLANNAGEYVNRGWMDSTPEQWAELFQANVLSTMRILIFAACFIAAQFVAATSRAQGSTPKLELGAQLSIVNFNGLREKPAGIGARFHYNFDSHLAADAEVTHYFENPSGDYGETTGLFGVRVGHRWEHFGAFARSRGGFAYFGGVNHNLLLPRKTLPAFDFGGALEYYLLRHCILRLEAGDLVIPYGNAKVILDAGATRRLGTRYNLTTSLGFAIRF
jgi:NAD(P)-dependent dehydrogenase (short-subunit alcohol dehydrogenase family)